jgi:predicted RNA-binding protein YlqC (UPF0109 family)
MNDNLKSLVTDIVKSIVDKPDDLKISVTSFQKTKEILITPHRDDVKLVIGRSGQNIEALRTLLYAKASKRRERYFVIVDAIS